MLQGCPSAILIVVGLIQNESADVIEVVRDLAVSRIKSDNTLILVTIPMSGNFLWLPAANY